AVSKRLGRRGKRCCASIPTTPWNTAAKSCPSRTPPISSSSWKGYARPVSYDDG
ncbi:hypothetical protein IB244_30645, partial [Rhizobium sp. RHZ02]|nr:hypothetical protein [Rhizobium sp. RHZ02]